MADSLKFTDIVAAQGGTATNTQTGAITTYNQGALSSTGFNYNDATGFTTSITPESLQPAQITPFAQPAYTPPPDINALFATPPLTATPTETQAQSLSDRLMTLNDQLVGKSAYQTQQDTKFGVDAAQKTLTDLGSQLTQLKNEAAAIPLQIQQKGTAAGTPQPFLAGQENSRLRTNAIAALGVSSLMAAAQGQLANAQSLADKAVSAKFDPIIERINALTSNLNLILNSPNYTLEQKNRAQKQLDQQNANLFKIEQQREATQNIYQIALSAAQNGADAQTLQAIQNASSPIEAAKAYSGFVLQQKHLELIQASGISTPYANSAGEIWDSRTGRAFTSEADFQAKTGMTIQQAQSSGLVSPVANIGLDTKYQLGYNPITGEASIFNPDTGQLMPANGTGGGSPTGFGTAPQGGFRTDRHNNPTAMTTDVARSLGLVEGVDYTKGDPFPNNPNLFTARLLGDPIQTTIKALDSAAASSNMQAFYTQSGGQRWTYIGMSDAQWQGLSTADKTAVITKMYQQEGGSGVLVGATAGGDIIDQLVAQVQRDPSILATLESAQQKAVTARMAQLGLPIPGKTTEPTIVNRLSGSELNSWQGTIDDQLKSGVGLGTVRSIIDSSNLQQADKETLKSYAESLNQTYNQTDGFWSNLLKSVTG